MAKSWIKIGHRGAPREFPANTMQSFRRAVELGCDMVECDVRQARDGVLVLAHDAHVTEREGRSYRIAEQTGETLKNLDLGAGEGVPTLRELALWAQGRCAVMADMKCEGDGVEQQVADALAPLPPEAKIVPGAGAESRRVFRAYAPDLPLSLSLNHWEGNLLLAGLAGFGFARMLAQIDTQAVTWEHPLLTAERIAALQKRGLRVYAWTVDDPDIMRRLITDGVDGIISNRPDLMGMRE
jgi:glycerophosphoryl diester phosphodiesterase